MRISELSHNTSVHIETIRYYERIGLLPPPHRTQNGYRDYNEADVERLHFIYRARQLDFGLDAIREILDFREQGVPPCQYVMRVMDERINEIAQRIADLQRLRDELTTIAAAGKALPEDVQMRECVCHLITTGLPQEA